jgi:hypothetical protein
MKDLSPGAAVEKVIPAAGYNGPDRRTQRTPSRASDIIAANLKLVSAIVGVILMIAAATTAWTTSQWKLSNKVDREEFVQKNADQDAQRALIERRAERLESTIIEQIAPTLKRLDERVSAMYCAEKPPGCK